MLGTRGKHSWKCRGPEPAGHGWEPAQRMPWPRSCVSRGAQSRPSVSSPAHCAHALRVFCSSPRALPAPGALPALLGFRHPLLFPNPWAFPYLWGRSAPQLSSQPLLGELCTPAASQQGCPFPPPLSQPSVFPRQRLPTILTSARRDLSIFCDTEYPLVAGSEESQHLLPTSLHVAVCRGSGRHKVTSGEGVPRGTEMCQPRQLMQTPLLLLGERCQARMQLTAGCCREGRGWGRWGKADHRA